MGGRVMVRDAVFLLILLVAAYGAAGIYFAMGLKRLDRKEILANAERRYIEGHLTLHEYEQVLLRHEEAKKRRMA